MNGSIWTWLGDTRTCIGVEVGEPIFLVRQQPCSSSNSSFTYTTSMLLMYKGRQLCVLFHLPLLALPLVGVSMEDGNHLVLVLKELLRVIFGVLELLLDQLGALKVGLYDLLDLGDVLPQVAVRKLVQLPVERVKLRAELLLHVDDVLDLRGHVVDLPA